MKKTLAFIVALLSFLPVPLFALSPIVPTAQMEIMMAAQAFRYAIDIPALPIQVPTVVQVPLGETRPERPYFLVEDLTDTAAEPYLYSNITTKQPTRFTVGFKTSEGSMWPASLTDDNPQTYFELPLQQGGTARAEMYIAAQEPFPASGVALDLSQFVALPRTVSVRAFTDKGDTLIVAERPVDSPTIRFPEHTSDSWTVSLTYAQPVRISEVRMLEESVELARDEHIRFLAQPGHTYRLYLDADRALHSSITQPQLSSNLASDAGVRVMGPQPVLPNPRYQPADVDYDGVVDRMDNCPMIVNADQLDVDGNGKGDACDDFDRDEHISVKDNCPNEPNFDQRDTDGDGMGDVCDGQESRLTERFPWIPWVGIVGAGGVLIVLFALTARSIRRPEEETTPPHDTPVA